MDLICPLHVHASRRVAASRGSTPRQLEAHTAQLDCPNYPKSFKRGQPNILHTRNSENIRKTQLSHFQEKKETRQEIYNRRRHQIENQHPKRDQKHLRLKRYDFLLEPEKLTSSLTKTESWCFPAETKLNVFWLRHNTFFLKSNFHIFVWSPHQNSLQCLSLSRKRNQEPVDISHISSISILFWRFHISMF